MANPRTSDHHSDLGPSSKDWAPGSVGRDEDYTPEKDLWAQTHGGAQGGSLGGGSDVQPGTQREGKSWQSERPDPADEDDKLDTALQDTFPASDPPAPAQPDVTGWDVEETGDEDAIDAALADDDLGEEDDLEDDLDEDEVR
jgi:hypothetical protein